MAKDVKDVYIAIFEILEKHNVPNTSEVADEINKLISEEIVDKFMAILVGENKAN